VKNRFQSLPFKCNLQRYTEGEIIVWKFPSGGGGGDDDEAAAAVGTPAITAQVGPFTSTR
jgi:hypothetical protein